MYSRYSRPRSERQENIRNNPILDAPHTDTSCFGQQLHAACTAKIYRISTNSSRDRGEAMKQSSDAVSQPTWNHAWWLMMNPSLSIGRCDRIGGSHANSQPPRSHLNHDESTTTTHPAPLIRPPRYCSPTPTNYNRRRIINQSYAGTNLQRMSAIVQWRLAGLCTPNCWQRALHAIMSRAFCQSTLAS